MLVFESVANVMMVGMMKAYIGSRYATLQDGPGPGPKVTTSTNDYLPLSTVQILKP